MATKTLKVNVTITISTIQSSHPSAAPCEIWHKINVQPFFIQPVTPSSDKQTHDVGRQLLTTELGPILKKR